ncbi:MAG: hypothetical protein LQ342_003070 [Letrouitia transgressa]|nr:MAG: hypothetical protein LQ342_003070 [Letrouitia transgressa]
MPPPSQSPGNASSVSPTSRESYPTVSSHVPRYTYPPHRIPDFPVNPPPLPMLNASNRVGCYDAMSPSTGTSGYGSSNASQGEAFPLGSQANVPPFKPTRTLIRVVDAAGVSVNVELHAKIDKGFFKADQDWTCYRRNYFAVIVHYVLKPYSTKSEPLFLERSAGANSDRILSFAVCIIARVDGEDGKVIELVQHTPKRDKGPMGRPEKMRLLPHTSGGFGVYPEQGGGLSPRSQLSADHEAPYAPTSPTQQQSQTVATFDRIQFKNATANNGKRRAAQQYFHIVAELFAEIAGSQGSDTQWVKIATRISAPMVVRGRSPGHYSDDRRGSSASRGGPGGGSSGDSGGSQRDPRSRATGGPHSGVTGMFSNPPRLGSGSSGNYLSHRPSSDQSLSETQSNQSSASSDFGKFPRHPFGHAQEPILTAEEEHAIEHTEGYQYYPSPLYEVPATSESTRPILSSLLSSPPHADSPFAYQPTVQGSLRTLQSTAGQGTSVKEEHLRSPSAASDGGRRSQYSRPGGPDTVSSSTVIRGCGRFQGMSTSKGFYPETPAW